MTTNGNPNIYPSVCFVQILNTLFYRQCLYIPVKTGIRLVSKQVKVSRRIRKIRTVDESQMPQNNHRKNNSKHTYTFYGYPRDSGGCQKKQRRQHFHKMPETVIKRSSGKYAPGKRNTDPQYKKKQGSGFLFLFDYIRRPPACARKYYHSNKRGRDKKYICPRIPPERFTGTNLIQNSVPKHTVSLSYRGKLGNDFRGMNDGFSP